MAVAVIAEIKGSAALSTELARAMEEVAVTPERVRASAIEIVNSTALECAKANAPSHSAHIGGGTWFFQFNALNSALKFGCEFLHRCRLLVTEKGLFFIKPSIALAIGEPKLFDGRFLDDESIGAYRLADGGKPFYFYLHPNARRLRFAAWLAVIFCCFQTEVAAFAADLKSTIPSCPRWVAQADAFLAECENSARGFDRTFYPSKMGRGEREENAAWFSPASLDGHFFLGCTLNFKRKVSFIGIYYTMEPKVVAEANTAPIAEIGFNGEVVISIDNHPVTLVPVRPFDTPQIRANWPLSPANSSKIPVNCQDPRGEDGLYHREGSAGPAYIDLTLFDRVGIIYAGSSSRPKNGDEYTEFFPSSVARDVIYTWFFDVLVASSGSLFVRKSSFPHICEVGFAERIKQSPLLEHQLCRLQKRGPWQSPIDNGNQH